LALFSKAGFLSVPSPEFSFLFPFYTPYSFTKRHAWFLLLDGRYLKCHSVSLPSVLSECFVAADHVVDTSHGPTAQDVRKIFAFAIQIREKKKTSHFFLLHFF